MKERTNTSYSTVQVRFFLVTNFFELSWLVPAFMLEDMCLGQIELYTHVPVMQRLLSALQAWNFRLCGVFLLDTHFLLDIGKFFSGCLVALSAMVGLEIPCLNVLSKMDLLSKRNREILEAFLDPSSRLVDEEAKKPWNKKYRILSRAIGHVVFNIDGK